MSLLINKRMSLRILIMGKFKKSTRLLLAKQLIYEGRTLTGSRSRVAIKILKAAQRITHSAEGGLDLMREEPTGESMAFMEQVMRHR